jgi:hypothetical protein
MMSKFKKYLSPPLLALALLLPVSTRISQPTEAEAQVVLPDGYANAEGVGVTIGAVSTDVGILVKYVGTSPAGGTVTVAAGGGITLKTGAVGSSTADATTECPVSGALGGVIDVTNAACDTLGEVVDAINASANWRAVIVDGLRSDSSNDTLGLQNEISASGAKGVPLNKDTTVAKNVSLALEPFDRLDIRNYLIAGSGGTVGLNYRPQADHRAIMFFASGTFTGTGADTFEVISAAENLQRCSLTATAVICSASEDAATIMSTPGGGTGVNKEYPRLVYGRKGDKLLVRLKAATTFTAAFLSANGLSQEFKAN